MKISKDTVRNIAKEAFNEILSEMEIGVSSQPDSFSSLDDDTLAQQVAPNKKDKVLGGDAAKLAQLKGELATVLDRAEREGIINRSEGKTRILRLPQYQQLIGNLPQQIKILRLKVLGSNSDSIIGGEENSY
jgi:hypothetical protein